MSAPTPAPGDDRPREGYYPDPSIPGYVRYWNGASWVPGTSRPAPKDGEPLIPPPGVRPATPPASPAATPAVEETGPHFFDEDPQPQAAAPWGTDPRVPADTPAQPASSAPSTEGTTTVPPAENDAPDPGTFVFRRPIPGPAQPDKGTMTFRPVREKDQQGAPDPRTGSPSGASGAPGFGAQGPVGMPGAVGAASGPYVAGGPAGSGFAAGQAAARAATEQQPGQAAQPTPAQSPQAAQGPQSAPAAPLPQQPHPQQPGPYQAASPLGAQGAPLGAPAGNPLTSGPGGGQASWAQQVHQLAGGADEQPVAPWKPPVEDVFQAAARRQAAARPAGLGKRFAARLIDTLVTAAVTAAAAVPFGIQAADHIRQKVDAAEQSGHTVTVWLLDGTTATGLGVVLAVLLLFGVVYEVLPTVKWGRTLGKKLCGLEVRDIEAHEPPTFGPALRRWLVYSVPGLLGVGIVGVLWCLFDRPWHQCWHDKAAHTFVAG
ncbi:RDD family protein [Streptomyces sp. NPDC001606]